MLFSQAYNEALEVHDLTRPQDVLQHLQHKIEKKMSKDETTECEKQVYDLYKGGKPRYLQNTTCPSLFRTVPKSHMNVLQPDTHIIFIVVVIVVIIQTSKRRC